jgi:CBS domain-containing protein
MKVKEAMHAGVQWVEPNTPLITIAKLMRDHDVGALPVGENDRLVGMVTDRDIVCRAIADGRNLETTTARDVMSKGIFFCRTDEELDEAVHLMEKKKVRRLPVINQDKRMVGMLSLGDISHTGSRQLCGEVLEHVAAHHA